jgi:hypothetical protein
MYGDDDCDANRAKAAVYACGRMACDTTPTITEHGATRYTGIPVMTTRKEKTWSESGSHTRVQHSKQREHDGSSKACNPCSLSHVVHITQQIRLHDASATALGRVVSLCRYKRADSKGHRRGNRQIPHTSRLQRIAVEQHTLETEFATPLLHTPATCAPQAGCYAHTPHFLLRRGGGASMLPWLPVARPEASLLPALNSSTSEQLQRARYIRLVCHEVG